MTKSESVLQYKGMKNVTFTVDFAVKLNDDVDPNDVSFEVDLARVNLVQIHTKENVGRAEAYTTMDYTEDE